MERLKKLKSWISFHLLFHYQITTDDVTFYQLHSPKYNISINSNQTITFYGGKKLYNEIKKYENVEVINLYAHNLNILFVKRVFFSLLFLLIVIIFLSSNRIIREIKFVNPDYYDQRIYDYIYQRLDKIGLIYTYEHDLNQLSLDLRANFPNYAYIGVTRNASCLLIDIEKIDIAKKENVVKKMPCDLISNYNGVIYSIESTSGVVKVEINQFVKKGDVLISGNLLIDNNPSDLSKLVEAKGIIVGTTIETKKIVVKKNKQFFMVTNNFKKRINVKIKNRFLFKFNDYYKYQKIRLIEKISLFGIVKIYEEKYYQQDFIDLIYDYDAAYNYAVSMLEYELELNRVSMDEKIIEVRLINYLENCDDFTFNFVVKKRQNLVTKHYY